VLYVLGNATTHIFSAPIFYTLTWQEHFHLDVVERDGNVRKRIVEKGKMAEISRLGGKKKKISENVVAVSGCKKMEVRNGCKFSISGSFLSNCSLGF